MAMTATNTAEREATLAEIRQGLRVGQQRLADWSGGPLAVSAVPGAGKSTGMAAAAALAIARQQLHGNCQLLLVTFTRSAAANLKVKVQAHLRTLNLPFNSFSVQTLHGLALSIATRNPELSNLSLETLTLVSPLISHRLIRTSVEQWIVANPGAYQQLIEGRSFDGEETERLRRQSVLRTEVLPAIAAIAVREAKSSGISSQRLMAVANTAVQRLPGDVEDYAVLAIAAGLYERYQALIEQRGIVDYDDMILGALRALEAPATRRFWQKRIFAVFEDEAQDSSPLQTQLLTVLAADPEHPASPGNLIRVGDPNQAINSTFTPADPIFFNRFCDACRHNHRLIALDQAGRSTAAIMDGANFVLRWVNQSRLAGDITPFREQVIRPVPKGDPQPQANPAAEANGLEIHLPETITETVKQIAERVADIYSRQPSYSFAVLVRDGRQGRFLAKLLSQPETIGVDLARLSIHIYDVGARDRQTQVPNEVLFLLKFLQRPHSPDTLKAALRILVDRRRIPPQDLDALAYAPEKFLYPGPLDSLPNTEAAQKARRLCVGLLRSRLELPLYSLISFISLTLGYGQSELATADKLAARISQETRQEQTLSAMIDAIQAIVSSERFEGVDTEDSESQYTRAGQLTLMTMHKAKGLDWDVVFLPFLQARTLPGRLWIPPAAEFLGDFTLAEVARAQIRNYSHTPKALIPDSLSAWQQAKQLKIAEEYRLLYVAMTRAKRLLWMASAQAAPFSWNKPESLQAAEPSPVIPALERYLLG